MYITAGKYQRKKSSDWELCIIIESSKPYRIIINEHGTIIKKVYDCKTLEFDLLIDVGAIFDNIKSKLNK